MNMTTCVMPCIVYIENNKWYCEERQIPSGVAGGDLSELPLTLSKLLFVLFNYFRT